MLYLIGLFTHVNGRKGLILQHQFLWHYIAIYSVNSNVFYILIRISKTSENLKPVYEMENMKENFVNYFCVNNETTILENILRKVLIHVLMCSVSSILKLLYSD